MATVALNLVTDSLDNKYKAEVNPISKKVAKILDSKIETDREIIDAFDTVSAFYQDNTLHNRRNLRRDIEHFSLQVNLEFLANFRNVKQELDKVSTSIAAMSACCSDMSQRLQATKSQTRDLISQTTKLQSTTKKIEQRAGIAQSFLSIFQLTPMELQSLQKAKEGDITKDFFDALRRVKEIHSDCKQLLLSGQHTAVMEVMESMATHQETAYEMLYRWIQSHSEAFNVEGNGHECNELISWAFSTLESRPVLFKYSLDECCTSRRNFVVRTFLTALTKGSTSGIPKPIELLSHDPLRYVNDMLAWIHQTLASEKEFIQTLLKSCPEETMSQFMPETLTQITEGLSRPFKVRVEQVISGEHGPVILYKLSNLFRFYYSTIRPSLQDNAPLLEVINDFCDQLVSLFRTSLVTLLNKLLEKVQPPAQDLVPVQGIHQVLLMLREVLEAHDSVLLPTVDKKDCFAKIFATVIDSLLNTLALTSTELNAVDLSIYMLNSLHLISSMLSLYEYTEDTLEMLQAQIDVHIGVLISEQAGYILQRSSLSNVYNLFSQHRSNHGPAKNINSLDPDSIKSALAKFDLFLSSPDSYKLSQCTLISSLKLRQSIDRGTMEAIISAYTLIYDKIQDPKNSYTDKIILRTAEDVRSLLG